MTSPICYAFSFIFLGLTALAQAETLPSPLHFKDGKFESSHTTSPECDAIFDQKEYAVSHYLVGANRLTSVLHFESKEKAGFFHPLTLVGRFGYQNDFLDEKQFIAADGFFYKVQAAGMVSRDFITMDISVTKSQTENSPPICQGEGSFSAFH